MSCIVEPLTTQGPRSTDPGISIKSRHLEENRVTSLTASLGNIKTAATSGGRAGGICRPALVTSSSRRRQRPLHTPKRYIVNGVRFVSTAQGNGQYRNYRSRRTMWSPQYEPVDSTRSARTGDSPWTRNVNPISLHGRNYGVSWGPTQ